MANIRRFTWLRNRLPSVVGRRLCIGGNVADHEYCFKLVPTRLFIYPYHAQSTQDEHLVVGTQSSPVRDYQHVRSAPLLDLLSVSIHSSHNATSDNCKKDQRPFEDYGTIQKDQRPFQDYGTTQKDQRPFQDYGTIQKDQRPFQVYGTIQLIDVEKNSASYVYCRRSSKPETVLPGYNLTLINSKGSYCSLHMLTAAAYKMRLNLKDANFDGRVIAKGDFDLRLFRDDDGYSDKIMTQVVPGLNGFYASVRYATLPYAVVATVKLKLTKIRETGSNLSEPSHACIYGRISATSKLQQGNAISSALLDKPPCDPLMVNPRKRIKLQRHMLAVPGYSSLFEIKADLWDHHTNQQIATDTILANCEVWDEYVINQKCVLGQNYHVQVQICWNNAYGVLDKERKQILDDRRSYWSWTSRWSQSAEEELMKQSPIPFFIGSPMVEVFSISVFPDDADSRICGKIYVYDDDNFGGEYNPYYLFNRDRSDAVFLSKDMKINSLAWPGSPFRGPVFSMLLRLSDKKRRVVCCGHLIWNEFSFDTPAVTWYGKLISSVIRGEDGYATVHYAMFPNAVQAKVRVEVIPDDSEVECKVGGNISAWYSKLYSSCSEKKFCQNILLGGDDLQSIKFGDNALKLQKSILVMPLDSSLILGIKLHVVVIGKTLGNCDEAVDFKIDAAKPSLKSIPGQGYKVDVSVEWSRVDRRERVKVQHELEEYLRSLP